MRYHELYEVLHHTPFEPFRIRLTDGRSHVIRHRDFAWLTRGSAYIGIPSGKDEVPDLAIQFDLLHVVSVEPANGKNSTRRGRSGGFRE
jgi:hypothetical protein